MRLPSLMTNFAVYVAALVVTSTLSAKQISFGIVTPKGSTWTTIVQNMKEDLVKQTGGKLDLSIKAGGVKGDEVDMLRAMEQKTLHAAALSGVGLGQLVPSIRILEAPLLFKTNEELDKVKEVLFDDFAKEFDKKGYVLLGFAEAGFVNVFSKQKIDNEAALKNIKMWVWTGDDVAARFLEEFGIRSTPLALHEVGMALDQKSIDSFYAPPLAALAFQWFSKVKYMIDYPFVNSTGAFIMKKDKFNSLPADQQKILRDTAKVYSQKVIEASRKDNEIARGKLTESGITFLKPSDADIKKYQTYADNVYKKSMPVIYSKELFDRVQGILKSMRK
ncbi:MAG: TRAP transporter substrate-binding protein DctP [Pseudobdellovibrionaceae bacterium]|nr:TRAP transporter substrate-binding protein DctP [Pseudobdellovibrionaceae bacterium]